MTTFIAFCGGIAAGALLTLFWDQVVSFVKWADGKVRAWIQARKEAKAAKDV